MTEVSIEKNLLDENARNAQANRERFARLGVYVLNLMSGAGAGKTMLLEKTAEAMKGRLRLAIVAADLETRRDADRLAHHGAQVTQVNTKGACHIEAHQLAKACEAFDLTKLDLVIIENVGNLVCPAEFDLGETGRAMILSCTEGDDKPGKYPLMFTQSQLMILSKVDLLPHTSFSVDAAIADARALNPSLEVLQLSSRTGDGLEAWYGWLEAKSRGAKR